MNRLEFLKFLANAPKNLKGYDELLAYARNVYKQAMGVFPEGIDNISIKQAVKETAENRSKLIQFPLGGKDKTNPFSVTVLDDAGKPLETKATTPEGIMDLLRGKGKAKDVNIGKAPKTTKKKQMSDPTKDDYVDPESYEGEELANIEFKEFSDRIKGMSATDRVAERLKDLKGVDLSNLSGIEAQKIASELIGRKGPFKTISNKGAKETLGELESIIKKANVEDFAQGGRIGFSGGSGPGGGAGFAGNQYVMGQQIPGNPQVPMGQFGLANLGIFGGGGYSKNEIVPGVDMATTNQNLGITGQIPIGNTGFTLGGSYMKSRANERFTGPLIPNQVFKNVPADSDRFNVGINFTKRFKDGGRIGFKDGSNPKDPSRRGFLKLMGGLAAIPFIGKYFKPAAKVADKAAPIIQDGVKLGYEKFMLLVDKIKRLGKTADDLATKERERVTRYDGKDGNEYELVEDLTTGNISVTKDKPGVAVYGRGTDDVQAVDVIENRSTFIYKKGEDVVNTKTGKSKRTPDEYEEVTQTSSGPEDAFDDVTEIDERAVKEVLEELGETRIKKSGGGLAYMLGE